MTDHVKCPTDILTSGCGVAGRKEGWKEEEGEGSRIDKSVPKKRFTQSGLAGNWTGDDYSFSWIRSPAGLTRTGGARGRILRRAHDAGCTQGSAS